MGISAQTVYCAKCVNCINNNLRLGKDGPGVGCEWCYGERLSKSIDLILGKVDAIWSLTNVLKDRYNKTFIGDGKYVEDMKRRYQILRDLNPMLDEILDEKDADKVKAIKKRYDDEYFADIRKSETN